MKKYKWIIILVNLVILLGVFNSSILKEEKLLSEGKLLLLELAPVDPRSLMQGDYMILRYAILRRINGDNIAKQGFCVVKLKANGVAERVRIQEGKTPLNKGEHLIKYISKKRGGINIGAESFFFQEGHAEKYEKAKYGGVKVDEQGNALLIGLYDGELKKIE